MNGELVGVWSSTSSGVDTLAYEQGWLDSPHGRPISLNLQFLPNNEPHSGAHVAAWFDNLLPDSDEIRSRIARRYRTKATTRDLLREIGRDCVGAIQLLPRDEAPEAVRTIDATEIDSTEIARSIRGVTSSAPLGQTKEEQDFRISLAGAQEKTAFLRVDGRWYRPHGSTPSTHILKLPLGLVGSMRYDMQYSVENEWLCMQILSAMGFDVPSVEMETFEDAVSVERVLVVERFDRVWADDKSHVIRLPQEDFCQALGVPPALKYEVDGGPGISAGTQLLRTSLAPEDDVRTFVLAQLAFWLLAATDGHAKNFSLFLNRDGHVMTPLYDVISAWPIIGKNADQLPIQKVRMAMALRGKNVHRELDRIATRHWQILAEREGQTGMFEAMMKMVERVPQAITTVEQLLPDGFPAIVAERIFEGMKNQARRFSSTISE